MLMFRIMFVLLCINAVSTTLLGIAALLTPIEPPKQFAWSHAGLINVFLADVFYRWFKPKE